MKHQLHTHYLDMSCAYSPAPKELISVCEESGQVLDVLMESESRGDKGQCRASAWAQLGQLSPSASHLGHLSLVCSHPSPSCGGAGILESRLPWKGAGPERKTGLTALRGSYCQTVHCFLMKKIAPLFSLPLSFPDSVYYSSQDI